MKHCQWCDEPVQPNDVLDPFHLVPMHRECAARSIIGSVAHIERRCGCYIKGASETDPPDMTRREAAKAALAAWEKRGPVIPRS